MHAMVVIPTIQPEIQYRSQQPVSTGKKKRRRRRRRRARSNSSASSDDSSTTSSCKSREPEEVPLVEQEQYVALDCEMVGVGRHGKRSALARVTIVNWNEQVIYDEFVKQQQHVVDYRSYVSGISPTDLVAATVDLPTCRKQVLSVIHNKVLVGHALKNDLHALGITHPWQQTRDTAKYEPFMKTRFNDGILWPRKLKDLCLEKLHADIQEIGHPHSALEDACAALSLYKSVRPKWEKVMQYKIGKTAEIEHRQDPLVMWPVLQREQQQ